MAGTTHRQKPSATNSSARMFGRMVGYSAVCLGVIGAVVGLIIGLVGYPPTAWFAALEVGIPSALVGAIIGAVVGSITLATRGWAAAPGVASTPVRSERDSVAVEDNAVDHVR